MRYWTWGEIREKIEDEFDLQEEPDLLSAGELCGYLNDAIDACEQHFIGLGDYFLSNTTINLVSGTRDYDLPSDIYATKIRKLIYDYKEIKPLKKLEQVTALETYTGDDYSYLLLNNQGDKPKIRLYPTPATGGTLDLYYTRNANRITEDGGDSQEVDIPEAMLWIFEFLRMKLHEKEKQLNQVANSQAKLDRFEQMMLKALSARVDDENNHIDPDIELYYDHF